jgi:hypothetical protein
MRLQEPVIRLQRIRLRKIGPHLPAITVGFSGALWKIGALVPG